jgi:hypothetical protein
MVVCVLTARADVFGGSEMDDVFAAVFHDWFRCVLVARLPSTSGTLIQHYTFRSRSVTHI